MRRPVTAALLTFALAGPAVAGCSNGDDEATTRTTVATTAPTTVPELPTATSAPLSPLADQTPPKGANGVAIDAAGNLWVADLNGGQIVAVDSQTGEILRRFGADRGVHSPDDLAFDAAGNIWWTNYVNGNVGRIDNPSADGAKSVDVVSVGAGANPITIADDGTVYVGRTLTGRGLYAITPGPTAALDQIAADPGVINGFSLGPDGRLYSPEGEDGTVIAIDLSDGRTEVVAENLGLPVSVRWTDDGRLLVLEAVPPVISEVNPGTGGRTLLASASSQVGDNFAVAEDGTIYVTAFDKPSVTVISPGGETTVLGLGRLSR